MCSQFKQRERSNGCEFKKRRSLVLQSMGACCSCSQVEVVSDDPHREYASGARPHATAAYDVTVQVEGCTRVDINCAGLAELEQLPGIGKKKAVAIVAQRPFDKEDDLLAVSGIGIATLDKIRGRIQCGRHKPAAGSPTLPLHPSHPKKAPTVPGAHLPLFFPDGKLPCAVFLAENSCNNAGCKLAHKETGLSRLVRVLSRARRLDVAVYSINLDMLADALQAAHARGACVRIISDDEQTKSHGSAVGRLRAAGLSVRTDSSPRLHMHHKFAIVDGEMVAHGSFNCALALTLFVHQPTPYHSPSSSASCAASCVCPVKPVPPPDAPPQGQVEL